MKQIDKELERFKQSQNSNHVQNNRESKSVEDCKINASINDKNLPNAE